MPYNIQDVRFLDVWSQLNSFLFLQRLHPFLPNFVQSRTKKYNPVRLPYKEVIQEERELFSLPLRTGGLNIALPQDLHKNLEQSIELSRPLASFNNIQQCEVEQTKISLRQKSDNQRELISKKSRMENNLPEMKYIIQLASEKGASSWLIALPLSKHGFDLTKTEFRDGIALRYTWEAKNTPAICPCGKEFSLTNALHCAKGGYTHQRHNEIRDVFANLMDDVCHDVQIEPKLQSLDGEIFSSNSTTSDDDARLDIKANGLWGSRINRTFFDVKIFNPHAKSCPKTINDAYKYHESIKQNKYESAGTSASRVMKQLATKISEKRGEPYADNISYIRTKISITLLRSCVLCLRGCRALKPRVLSETSISAVVEEGRLH